MDTSQVLVAGGAGYIGSTIASACLDAGMRPVLVDNLATGERNFTRHRQFFEGDISDGHLVDSVFEQHDGLAVAIHCAGLGVVPDSLIDPLSYYEENVVKSIQFFRHLLRNGCHHLIFSSSASVYGASSGGALHEDTPIDPRTPYAQSKAMIERVLIDAAAATALNVVILRYFNPIGADPALRSGVPSGRVGGVLNSLIDAHRGDRPFLLAGTDYATRDGSALRDYLHVWDLAMAHVAVVRQLPQLAQRPGRVTTINLGSGSGTTVRELVSAFNEVTGSQLTVLGGPRRAGDIAGAFTSVDLAERLLGWRPAYSVRDAIRHALQWSEVGQPIKIAAS